MADGFPDMTASRGPRRLLIIFNPVAGWRRRRRLAPVLAGLRARGCTIELRETGAPGDAERFAAAADPDAFDLVVAAGGDGTVNETINGLASSGLPLALIPLGTANVLAAEIGLRTDPTRSRAASPKARSGRSRSAPPTAAASSSWPAPASMPTSSPGSARRMKGWLSKGAYVLATLRELATFGFPTYEVQTDNTTWQAASVIVANGRYYGGRFLCAPAARLGSETLRSACSSGRGVGPRGLCPGSVRRPPARSRRLSHGRGPTDRGSRTGGRAAPGRWRRHRSAAGDHRGAAGGARCGVSAGRIGPDRARGRLMPARTGAALTPARLAAATTRRISLRAGERAAPRDEPL